MRTPIGSRSSPHSPTTTQRWPVFTAAGPAPRHVHRRRPAGRQARPGDLPRRRQSRPPTRGARSRPRGGAAARRSRTPSKARARSRRRGHRRARRPPRTSTLAASRSATSRPHAVASSRAARCSSSSPHTRRSMPVRSPVTRRRDDLARDVVEPRCADRGRPARRGVRRARRRWTARGLRRLAARAAAIRAASSSVRSLRFAAARRPGAVRRAIVTRSCSRRTGARILGPLAPHVARGLRSSSTAASSVKLPVALAGDAGRQTTIRAGAAPTGATVRAVIGFAGGIPATDAHPMPILRSATDVQHSPAIERLAQPRAAPPPDPSTSSRSAPGRVLSQPRLHARPRRTARARRGVRAALSVAGASAPRDRRRGRADRVRGRPRRSCRGRGARGADLHGSR